MMTYLLLANLYLAIFYTFYHFFLRRETFFRLNRYYLLASLVLSFTLPLTKAPLTGKYGTLLVEQVRSTIIGPMVKQAEGIQVTGESQKMLSEQVTTPQLMAIGQNDATTNMGSSTDPMIANSSLNTAI